jgi:hypothetical protein
MRLRIQIREGRREEGRKRWVVKKIRGESKYTYRMFWRAGWERRRKRRERWKKGGREGGKASRIGRFPCLSLCVNLLVTKP